MVKTAKTRSRRSTASGKVVSFNDYPLPAVSKPNASVSDRKFTRRFLTTAPNKKLYDQRGVTGEFSVLAKATDTSNQFPDPFAEFYNGETAGAAIPYSPVAPPVDLAKLAAIPTISNVLRQCIEAYVTNIETYGYTLEYIGDEGKEDRPEVAEEKRRINALIKSNPGSPINFRELRERLRIDKETLGFRAIEVMRNENAGEVIGWAHVPALSVRKTPVDRELVVYEEDVLDEDTGEYRTQTVARRFRRFIQFSQGLQTLVYFKEFGDPRPISMKTGHVISQENGNLGDPEATEILWDEFYVPGSTYGLPRWIGVIPSILGSRESEVVNLDFFQDNAIPAMAVLVSGGALTEESFQNIAQYINAVKGRDAMQRVMVLEAAADETAGTIDGSQPAPKIDMKPMISERQQEGLFQDYDQKNMAKVRSTFRLPPIYAGRAEDYTRATAYTSMQVAETQVFIPERTSFDQMIMSRLLSSIKPRFHRFRSLGPSINDAEIMGNLIDRLGAQGALTPNVVIKITNRMMDTDIKPVLEAWGDYPFSTIMEYIRQGREVKGLNEFLEEMKTELPAAANSNVNVNPAQDGKPRSISKAELRERAARKKLAKSLTDNLQTFADDIADATPEVIE